MELSVFHVDIRCYRAVEIIFFHRTFSDLTCLKIKSKSEDLGMHSSFETIILC